MHRTHELQGLLFFAEPAVPTVELEPAAALPVPTPAEAEQAQTPIAPDQHDRIQALDISRSWIVQAPAGAGKTELLTQRFLSLLAVVEEPEEILAITFTRAATAEMRGRILSALSAARHNPDASPREPTAITLARAALRQSDRRNWQLLEQPHRLDVQTIDSLCMQLAHGQPLLARLGGRLTPTEQPAELYALAAQRTFERLGTAQPELEAALRHLLLLRDNNLRNCRRLIAAMLAGREQWRHIFPLAGHATIDWPTVRAQLEASLATAVDRVLRPLHAILAAEPALADELLELARYACANDSRSSIALLDGLRTLPGAGAESLDHWIGLHHFLLTKGSWRRSFTKRDGFPVTGALAEQRQMREYKHRMEQLTLRLAAHPAAERLRSLLCAVTTLPSARYDDTQWQTLLSVFRVLRQAAAELHVVFAERDQVDFAELSIAAATLLDEEQSPRGLLASEARRHLLIDEFQDTSRHQHQLIGSLLREWQPGDGRTCFLVGDPMQSIYIFRQAEVELFGRVQRQGLDCGGRRHPCARLTLSANFRSHGGLVDPLNRHFAAIFATPEIADADPSEVPFTESKAAAPALPGESVQVHAFFHSARDPMAVQATREAQTAHIVNLVRQQLPQIEAAQALAASPPLPGSAGYTVAILGRARAHLAPIAAALRAAGIAYRAIELETLSERQEILDLLSLLRALLHPSERIAWLSVLRAPWCGLTLADLHALTGADDRSFRFAPVPALIRDRAHLLTPDGQTRLARVSQILGRAVSERFRRGHAHSLAAWLERTWTSLAAPAYLRPEEHQNAELFFQLLDTLSADGIDVLNGALDTALARLCAAPDASVSEHCGVQLMTIHKAKGLGFDVVLVPSLERTSGREGTPLITTLERAHRESDAAETTDEILIAPLGRHGEQHRTYKWVQAERRKREAGERKRLFYVACTRARRTLHLVGSAELTAGGRLKPGAPDSLLACAWPALGPLFEQQLLATENRQATHTSAAAQMPSLPPQPGVLDLAAQAAASARPSALHLWRLPSDFTPRIALQNVTVPGTYRQPGQVKPSGLDTLTRPEGSFEQRARGNAIHAMLELISEAWARDGAPGDAAALTPQLDHLARAVLTRAGLAPSRVQTLRATLVPIVLAAAAHPDGRWVLGPHPDARSEWSFARRTAGDGGAIRTLRVDRLFRAGGEPGVAGAECLWIVDYKTGAEPGSIAVDAYLESQKEQWRPQLEEYGTALRALFAEPLALRYALYFPELLRIKTWQ